LSRARLHAIEDALDDLPLVRVRLGQRPDAQLLVVAQHAGDDDRDFKWNNYISRYHTRHLDLMDLLAMYQPRANAPLDELAKLMGLPGKLGMDGSQVWQAWQEGRVAEIRDYCETDVVNTYLVFLRFQLMRGVLSPQGHAKEIAFVTTSLKEQKQAHWKEFLAGWPA
jgi:predicted PolB exonuclease-like 3'-5' exonuclease